MTEEFKPGDRVVLEGTYVIPDLGSPLRTYGVATVRDNRSGSFILVPASALRHAPQLETPDAPARELAPNVLMAMLALLPPAWHRQQRELWENASKEGDSFDDPCECGHAYRIHFYVSQKKPYDRSDPRGRCTSSCGCEDFSPVAPVREDAELQPELTSEGSCPWCEHLNSAHELDEDGARWCTADGLAPCFVSCSAPQPDFKDLARRLWEGLKYPYGQYQDGVCELCATDEPKHDDDCVWAEAQRLFAEPAEGSITSNDPHRQHGNLTGEPTEGET